MSLFSFLYILNQIATIVPFMTHLICYTYHTAEERGRDMGQTAGSG